MGYSTRSTDPYQKFTTVHIVSSKVSLEKKAFIVWKLSPIKLELSLNVIKAHNSSLSQNRLMSQESKISDWRVNYTRAITEGNEYPAI